MGLTINRAKQQHDEPRRNYRSWTLWRLAATAIVGALLVVAQTTNYTHHFHVHLAKHRILRNLQEKPALRLTFELKHKAMRVHGATTFDVVVTPTPQRSPDDTSMVYNGMASFEKDGDLHEYSLINGTTYYTWRSNSEPTSGVESRCLPSGTVPPIQDILNAIQTATTTIQSSDKCPAGSAMVFQFAGDDFILCSPQSSLSRLDDGFQIHGKHLNIGVKYEQSAPSIVAPRVSSEQLRSCGQVPFGARLTPSLPALLTRSFSEWTRALREEAEEFDFLEDAWDLVTGDDDKCGCKGRKRVCVFIAGLSSFRDHGMTDYDPGKYFGDDHEEHTPCCLSKKFITLATKTNRWNDPVFQKRLADLLLQASGTSDIATGIVKDTIIIAHSMGNLALSAAIAAKKVTLDSSTSWVGTSAPMGGSMGSNYIQESCGGNLGDFVASVIDLLGNCPVNIGETALAFQNTSCSTKELNEAYASAQAAYAANVNFVLCSDSAVGLATLRTAIYALAGEVVPHSSRKNDGIVEFPSCAMGIPHEKFGSKYTDTHYKAQLNHVDTSFRYGDGLFGDSRKPHKWLECIL